MQTNHSLIATREFNTDFDRWLDSAAVHFLASIGLLIFIVYLGLMAWAQAFVVFGQTLRLPLLRQQVSPGKYREVETVRDTTTHIP